MSTPIVANDIALGIEGAVKAGLWPAVKREVDNLSDALVEALVNYKPEFVLAAATRVEPLARTLNARTDLPAEGHNAAGQLRALATLLVYSRRRVELMQEATQPLDPYSSRLLEALVRAGGPLSNREISERTSIPPETVARKLGPLRQSGLVISTRLGKAMCNKHTRLAVERLKATGALPSSSFKSAVMDGVKRAIRRAV